MYAPNGFITTAYRISVMHPLQLLYPDNEFINVMTTHIWSVQVELDILPMLRVFTVERLPLRMDVLAVAFTIQYDCLKAI